MTARLVVLFCVVASIGAGPARRRDPARANPPKPAYVSPAMRQKFAQLLNTPGVTLPAGASGHADPTAPLTRHEFKATLDSVKSSLRQQVATAQAEKAQRVKAALRLYRQGQIDGPSALAEIRAANRDAKAVIASASTVLTRASSLGQAMAATPPPSPTAPSQGVPAGTASR